MRLYGARRCGSAITEGMLALAGYRYEFVDVDGFDKPGPARDRLRAVNPLHQVPALVLDDGTILTETAAITLYLTDRVNGLAPAIGTPDRTRFYQLLVSLVANVYPTFTYGYYPERWTPSAPGEVDDATGRYRVQLYLWLEKRVGEPFVLGKDVSARDVYVAVLVAWHSRLEWFQQNTPKIARIAERTGMLLLIAHVMKLNDWQQQPEGKSGYRPS